MKILNGIFAPLQPIPLFGISYKSGLQTYRERQLNMSRKRIKPKYKSKYVLTESGCEVLGIPYEPNKRATLSNILQMKNMLQLEGEPPMIEKNPQDLKQLEKQLIGIVAHLAKTYGQAETKKFIMDMVNDDCFWNALNEAIEIASPEKPRIITP